MRPEKVAQRSIIKIVLFLIEIVTVLVAIVRCAGKIIRLLINILFIYVVVVFQMATASTQPMWCCQVTVNRS